MVQRITTGTGIAAGARELVAPGLLEDSGRQVRTHALALDTHVLAPLEQTEALHGPSWTGLARERYLSLHQGMTQVLQQAQVRVDGLGAAMGRSAAEYERLTHTRFGPGGPATSRAALPTETEYVAGTKGGAPPQVTTLAPGSPQLRQAQQAQSLLEKLGEGSSKCRGVAWNATEGESPILLSGYDDPAMVRDVQNTGAAIGHQFVNKGNLDDIKINGQIQRMPGAFNASHSEEYLSVRYPTRPILAVDQTQCLNCQDYYWRWAQKYGAQYGDRVVADPSGIHFYHADGSIDFLRLEPTAFRTTRGGGAQLATQWTLHPTLYTWSGPNAPQDMQGWLSSQSWYLGRPPYQP